MPPQEMPDGQGRMIESAEVAHPQPPHHPLRTKGPRKGYRLGPVPYHLAGGRLYDDEFLRFVTAAVKEYTRGSPNRSKASCSTARAASVA